MQDTPTPNGSHDPLRIAETAAGIGVWEWDVTTGRMHYSARAKAICGFGPDQKVDIALARAVTHPDDLPVTSRMAARALDPDRRENVVYVYRIVRADNREVRWVRAYGEAVFGEFDGRETALRYFGTIQDITAERERDTALEINEAKLRLAMDTGQVALWEVDQVAGTIAGSKELNRLCGFPEDATPTLEEFRLRQAPGEMERLARLSAEAKAAGETRLQTELKFLWPDGTEKWALMRAEAAPGSEARVFGIMIDITERKLQEQRVSAVADELLHRMRNLIGVVQAIVDRSLVESSDTRSARISVRGRLSAMARSLEFIFQGADTATPLRALVEAILEPFQDGQSRIRIEGTDSELPERLITPLTLILHELATNAVKHGALSADEGHVQVNWQDIDGVLDIHWIESGGPRVLSSAASGGGMALLRANLLGPPHSIGIEFRPEGLVAHIAIRQAD